MHVMALQATQASNDGRFNPRRLTVMHVALCTADQLTRSCRGPACAAHAYTAPSSTSLAYVLSLSQLRPCAPAQTRSSLLPPLHPRTFMGSPCLATCLLYSALKAVYSLLASSWVVCAPRANAADQH